MMRFIVVTSNTIVSLDSYKKLSRVGARVGGILASCLSQASPTTLAILNLKRKCNIKMFKCF